MLSSRILGLPVLDIDRGKRLGTVRSIVLDPAERRVAALGLQLAEGWRKRGLIAVEDIYAIGEQAVTLEDSERVADPDPKSHLGALARSRVDLRGTPLVTERGHGLGVVAEFEFDLSGALTALHIQQGALRRLTRSIEPIPGAWVRAFGADAVIVSAEAERLLAPAEPSEATKRDTSRNAKQPTGWLAKARAMGRSPVGKEPQRTPAPSEAAPTKAVSDAKDA